jgi:iron(III) transport system substrate-binding protein
MKKTVIAVAVLALLTAAASAQAQQKILNLYSSRHYQTDEALYANFEKATGIKINRIEGPEDPLIERMKTRGESPADVLVTVDMGRLLAQQLGLFSGRSAVLEQKVPPNCVRPMAPFGFSVRAAIARRVGAAQILR